MSTRTIFTTNASPSSNQSSRRRNRRSRNRSRRNKSKQVIVLGTKQQPRAPRSRMIPAARTYQFRGPAFQRVSSSNSDQTIRLRGFDLVQSVPGFQYMSGASGVFIVIPSNPAYWTGTRVSGIAQVYQQFRPIKFDVKYVPSVPVTVPGNVIYGTLWQQGVTDAALQQSLATSNGGGITTCYQSTWSRVRCNQNTLPQRFYDTAGHPSHQSANPFHWIAYYSGGGDNSAAPGYVIVHWEYEFTVGLGSNTRSFATIDASDPTAKRVMQEMNSFSFFGVPLLVLKNYAVKLLRKVSIMLLTDALTHLTQGNSNSANATDETVTLPSGSTFEYIVGPNDSNGFSVVTQGSDRYEVPDDTIVFVEMCGQAISKRTITKPSLPVIDVAYITISGKKATPSYVTEDSGRYVNHYTNDVEQHVVVYWTPIDVGYYKAEVYNNMPDVIDVEFLTDIGILAYRFEADQTMELPPGFTNKNADVIITQPTNLASREVTFDNLDEVTKSIAEEY